jgi:hypothetical protein
VKTTRDHLQATGRGRTEEVLVYEFENSASEEVEKERQVNNETAKQAGNRKRALPRKEPPAKKPKFD